MPSSGSSTPAWACRRSSICPTSARPSLPSKPAKALAPKPASAGFFHFTMTPAPNFAGLRRSPIQQVYQ
ncbi:MAG: hypothetical protein E2587_11555 [Delftia sp.]|nr:hypothetical protein [Delftia sp.]